jgi:dipeptidase E
MEPNDSPRALLISNSTMPGRPFLAHAKGAIRDFLGPERTRVLFVPYAAVRVSHDEYAATAREAFESLGYDFVSLHQVEDPLSAVETAETIFVGGGNTFQLLRALYDLSLMQPIRKQVIEGVPYIGSSAGSNLACPTIRTTNDMPIVEPPSFKALGLVPFQVNPHYLDGHPKGHQGETREERIVEFLALNSGVYVVGLREGGLLRVEGPSVTLLGDRPARVFLLGRDPVECAPGDSLGFLL